ncbi:hypothetical protein GCM10011579_060890 [Streptomyces albiflavescens]|uniref:Trypsin-co-occurring domain-containing protein n=1 Tax=Streptomyces albiflavescens TaxID=1623582 RepID=A0A918D805_9ACTN|nr:CU044_2847 family protein [Streptomyces albiflavescens]GGN78079.1 hypothetical protein GCM10011579_060890 [Streptomyces albiflavescens]
MGDAVTRIARIEMPDGTPVWARISGAEELEEPSGGLSYTDTGFGDRVEAQVESLQSVITSVARSLAAPLRAVRPDEVSVEFGIELTAKAGKVVGLLADGEAKAGITVTLTWNGGPPDLEETDVNARPSTTTPHTHPTGTGGNAHPTGTGGNAHPTGTGGNPQPGSTGPDARANPPADPHAGASPGAPAHGGSGDASVGGGA